MSTTKQPADEIPDDLILAAIDRAARHSQRQAVPIWQVQEHLSAPRRSGQGRQVRARVLALADVGLLEPHRRHGVDVWTLTTAARQRLRRAPGIAEALPESPQHRKWREARTLAEQEAGRFAERMRATVAEAEAMLDAEGAPATSDDWDALAHRLYRQAWRMSAATHCLREWEEPSDEAVDVEDARIRGRRNVRLWTDEDEG
ncbi:MAG: hypothetical protein ABSB69_12320 [Solirubrobacteraceae bacterium]